MTTPIAPTDIGLGALVLFRMTPRDIAKHVGILTGPESFIRVNRPGFTGGQNSRRIAPYGTESKEEDLEAVFT